MLCEKFPRGSQSGWRRKSADLCPRIKDPFGCHDSYGAHMSALLLDGLDKVGMKYRFQSGYKAYKSGTLVKQIETILNNAEKIGQMIEELTGQKKYLESLPYFPQCEKCGRLNVARPYKFDSKELKVYYKCTGDEIGRKWLDGCGHEGAADIRKGEGKLSWKVEFAARWAAFDIRFEAHGKELTDSVKINDWISDNEFRIFSPQSHSLRVVSGQGRKKDFKIGRQSGHAPKVADICDSTISDARLLQEDRWRA